MSKRNIQYIKPDEPSFLKQLKQQAGYKEGPTVDTKREDLGPAEDLSDTEEEQPTIVVLNEGDLSAEEAAREKERLEKEAAEAPADLNTRIVFKAPNKVKNEESKAAKRPAESESKKTEKNKSKKVKSKALLSFDEEEEDDQDN